MKQEQKLAPANSDSVLFMLKEEARQISNVLLQAQESMKLLEALLYDDEQVDVYNKHNNYFWYFAKMAFSDQILLKLNILFTPKEHYSIQGLLKKLKEGGPFQQLIPATKIDSWEKEVEGLSALCKKISIRRNKQIAHKDRNYEEKGEKGIKVADLKKIIDLVQEIVREIYLLTIGGTFLISDPIGSPVKDLKDILLVLNQERKIALAPLFAQARDYGLECELPRSERLKK